MAHRFGGRTPNANVFHNIRDIQRYINSRILEVPPFGTRPPISQVRLNSYVNRIANIFENKSGKTLTAANTSLNKINELKLLIHAARALIATDANQYANRFEARLQRIVANKLVSGGASARARGLRLHQTASGGIAKRYGPGGSSRKSGNASATRKHPRPGV